MAFIFQISIPCDKTFLMVLSSRSSVKVKVEYQGHNFQNMAIAGALVFHKYIVFEHKNLRTLTCFVSDTQIEMSNQMDMTLKWQNGAVSNYDYLLYLNRYAAISFCFYALHQWVGQYSFCPVHLSVLSSPEHNMLKGSFKGGDVSIMRGPSCIVNNFF